MWLEWGVVRVGRGVWLEWGEGVVRVGRGVWLEWGEGVVRVGRGVWLWGGCVGRGCGQRGVVRVGRVYTCPAVLLLKVNYHPHSQGSKECQWQ